MFLVWLSHEVLERVRAYEARFVLARSRVLRDIRVAGKMPEFTSFPIATRVPTPCFHAANQVRAVVSGS